MVAIADHVDSLDDIEVAVVISDRAEAAGLEKAEQRGIATEVVAWKDHADRKGFTSAICDAIVTHRCETVVLAGFMRILSPEAVARFPNRILNIHPSLLPSFPGGHAIPDALAFGVKQTGVTIHLVDELVDHGPILTQEAVPVLDGDDEAGLHARIQQVEHRLYPETVERFVRGDFRDAIGARQ